MTRLSDMPPGTFAGLVPDYIARMEADVAAHRRAIAETSECIDRALKGMGQ